MGQTKSNYLLRNLWKILTNIKFLCHKDITIGNLSIFLIKNENSLEQKSKINENVLNKYLMTAVILNFPFILKTNINDKFSFY